MLEQVTHRASRPKKGYLRAPLGRLFSSAGNVAVLRALFGFPLGATGTAVGRAAGVTPQAAIDALARLEWIGLVHKRIVGRSHLFELNRDHWFYSHVVAPSLDAERLFRDELKEFLHATLEPLIEVGAIFGSMARGEDVPESDLDLCCVVRDETAKEAFYQRMAGGEDTEGLSHILWKRFGLRASPLVLTRREARQGLRSRRKGGVFRSLREEGILFIGDWEKVSHDSKIAKKARRST